MDALLGYTGFVGSHIRENLDPSTTTYFNSKNISEIVGQEFDTVYCACVPAVKWKANANPEEDFAVLNTLRNTLTSVRCRAFVLISTIDVHSQEVLDQVEDNVVPSKEAYGKNRYDLEVELRKHFGNKLTIFRLPALFGVGLKKNYLYDLMNNNQVDKINVNSAFQWYSVSWLWEDMEISLDDGRKVVNLYSESIETADIVSTFFPDLQSSAFKNGPRIFYSQSSNYGGRSSKEVVMAMDQYLAIEKMKTRNSGHLVASNMAWRREHNEHAAFLMQRYGINRLEILPTKFCSWEQVFKGNLQEELEVFRRHDISVYSVQSVFHGVPGRFGDDDVEKHLEKVVRFCEKVGAEVLVMGSPGMRGKNCDRKALADLLDKVQVDTDVKICLEPNSSAYKCNVGTTLDACREVRGNRNFWLNFDTGNAYMEKDRLPEVADKIGHVQISNALLKPMKARDYERVVESGMCGAIAQLLESSEKKGKSLKVSLEVSMFDNVKMLGEQMRRFSRFYRTYFLDILES